MGPATGVMVWVVIGYTLRTPLVHVVGNLSNQSCVSQLYLRGLGNVLLQQDKARPEALRRVLTYHNLESI
ncbi:hypothetical protein TNCV_1585971 [Trichonephila clavipes]|uniref:Uncharacterized protein n=1 Tax=Trichonephila clavipes TaxID=2585209 RepID=A0A8X6SDF2_TRICX|nr:hypothetical protein TNCV_1585971 [Trichonephila clavipes]